MSWVAPFLAIETKVADLASESSFPLIWAPTIDVPDDGNSTTIGDGGRPSTFHVVWIAVYTGTAPTELGWATESAAGSPPDETTGEVQFDLYSPSKDGTANISATAQAIRAHLRGVTDGGVRYGVPIAPQWLGNETGGWSRWVMRVPFTIEDA